MSTFQQFFGGGGGSSVPAAQGGPVSPGITVAEVLLVGGGGDGSAGAPAGNGQGGQGGSILSSSAIFFTQGTSYTITIGGAASNSSIAGGTLNLVAQGGSPGDSSLYRAESGRRLDEYTTVYALDGLPTSGQTGKGFRGGGGATSRGEVYSPATSYPAGNPPGGVGGDGLNALITGTSTNYGAGGGGGGVGQVDNGFQVFTPPSPGGAGGSGGPPFGSGGPGGVGQAGSVPSVGGSGTNGVANTGGGGGGGGQARSNPSPPNPGPGGTGGSGVCIIRWPTAYPDAPAVSGNTPTPAQPGYRVYRWNSGPGSITF